MQKSKLKISKNQIHSHIKKRDENNHYFDTQKGEKSCQQII